MADDMGFSDAGAYGGEIQTPHLDRLAEGGLRFRQFYNTARCVPTHRWAKKAQPTEKHSVVVGAASPQSCV